MRNHPGFDILPCMKIAVLDYRIPEEVARQMQALASNQISFPSDRCPEDERIKRTGDADIALVTPWDKIDADYLDACPHLKYIGLCGTSTANVDLGALARRGIAFTNIHSGTKDENAKAAGGKEAVAEFFFMQLVRLARGIGRHQWKPGEVHQLKGRSLGIVGLGEVGKGKAWTALTMSADGRTIAAADGSGGDIWLSYDSGTTWTNATPSGAAHSKDWSGLAANISGGNIVAVDSTAFAGDIYAGVNASIPQVTTTTENNVAGTGSVSLQTPSHTTVTCSDQISEASLPKQDAGYDYPLGLTSLCYTTLMSSDEVTVTFVTDLKPADVVARDFNTSTQTFTTIPGATVAETTLGGSHALALTYTITDNDILDSNPATSFVTDPVGLAVLPAAITTVSPKAPATGLEQVHFAGPVTSMVAGFGILLLLATPHTLQSNRQRRR